MKVVRLTSAQERAWRNKRAHWVSAEGKVLRAVTDEEEAAVFPAIQDAKRAGRSGSRTVTAVYHRMQPDSSIRRVEKPFTCRLDVTKHGTGPGECTVQLSVGGNRYMRGSEIILAEVLEKYGSCILNHVNGKRICVVRDPREKRPSFKESRSTPAPENCVCAHWIGTLPGRHHPSCEFNRYAPHAERAEGPGDTYVPDDAVNNAPIPEPGLASASFSAAPEVAGTGDTTTPVGASSSSWQGAPGGAGASLGQGLASGAGPSLLPDGDPPRPVPGADPRVSGTLSMLQSTVVRTPMVMHPQAISPEDCTQDCRGYQSKTAGWAYPRGKKPVRGQHHPLCKHYNDWLRHTQAQSAYYLYDIERQRALREATQEEVSQAEIQEQRGGLKQVVIGGSTYAVLPAEAIDSEGRLLDDAAITPQRRPEALQYTTPSPAALGLPRVHPPDAPVPEGGQEPEPQPSDVWQDPPPDLPHAPDGASGDLSLAPEGVSEDEQLPPYVNTEESLRDERGLVGEQRDPGIIETGQVLPVLGRPDAGNQ